MKNLIDVRTINFHSFGKLILNKIKVGMVCITAIALNGVFSEAIAGDMLTNRAAPEFGAGTLYRPNSTFTFYNFPAVLTTTPEEEQIPAEEFIPVFTGDMSSRYGTRRHPYTGKLKHHRGIDIRAPRGTPIYSPARGVVVFSGWKNGYGNVVCIDHQNGYVTLIAHNHRNFVRVGQEVDRTTKIATVGATGRATGPHMHIEVTLNGRQVNPEQFFRHPQQHASTQPSRGSDEES